MAMSRNRLANLACISMASLAGSLLLVAGCGRSPEMSAKKSAATYEMSGRQKESEAPGNGVAGDEEPINAQDPGEKKAERVQRKIKYTADIRLITENFTKAEDELAASIDENDGFLAFADVTSFPGQPRFGTWKARIPVEKFDAFRKGIVKIGEVESNKVNTEDVTAQFYDLENHIKNKKAQEDALRELLKRTTDKMENLLSVQRELSSVRDSIERSEGQLRLLANLSDLTTVTIRIQERRKFVPEKPPEQAEKPSFGSRVEKSFGESWRGVVEFVQDVAVGIVALTPWLPFVAILVGGVAMLYRRVRPTRREVEVVAPKT